MRTKGDIATGLPPNHKTQMEPTDNLHGLHGREEEIRSESLAAINRRGDLRDHWVILAEAMTVIVAFARDHQHQSDDELTLQLLGIRLFNAAGASIKLALSGFYQKAFDQVRDVLETAFLLDYFVAYPEKITEWTAADKKTRIAHFGPGVIRTALDKRDGYTSGARKAIYDLLSEAASHASSRGFALVANDKNLGVIGPFFDEKKLATWLQLARKAAPTCGASFNLRPEGSRYKAYDGPQALSRCRGCLARQIFSARRREIAVTGSYDQAPCPCEL